MTPCWSLLTSLENSLDGSLVYSLFFYIRSSGQDRHDSRYSRSSPKLGSFGNIMKICFINGRARRLQNGEHNIASSVSEVVVHVSNLPLVGSVDQNCSIIKSLVPAARARLVPGVTPRALGVDAEI